MKRTTKRIVTTGVLVTTLALGGAGVAMASTNGTGDAGSTSAEEQNPSYTGSVTAPQGTGAEGNDTKASEAAESASLQSLATTTPDEATAAALAAVPGTAGAVELENENGYVVYGVEVTGADGSVVDVKVDAGTGTVLAQDTDSETSDDVSDGDGETNDD